MCYTARILWNLVAIYSIILSCCLIAASIGSLLVYYCIFAESTSTFQWDNIFLTYVIYFFNEECAKNNTNYEISYFEPARRTWAWTIAYLALNVVWLITALLLIFGQCKWNNSSESRSTYPWIIVTVAVLCTDVASTVMYAFDFEEINTSDHLKSVLGLSVNTTDAAFEYYPTPTIIMVGIFSKCILGWGLLLVGFGIICCVSHNRRKRTEDQIMLQTRPFNNMQPQPQSHIVNRAYLNEMTEIELQSHTPIPQSPDSEQSRSDSNQFWGAPWQMIPRLPTRMPGSHGERRNDWVGESSSSRTQDQWEESQSPRIRNDFSTQFRYPEGHNSNYNNGRPWTYLSPATSPPPSHQQSQNYREQSPFYY